MNAIPDSTILRAAERVHTARMDELIFLARDLVNAINEDMDLRAILPAKRHERVRRAWDALHSGLEGL